MVSLHHVARAALAAVAFAATAVATSVAPAQEFPNRPVTIIVPFTAGGAGDILARMAGQQLERRWKQPVLVENKPGAGSIVGAQTLIRAAPDGHTLMIAPSATLAVNVTLYKALSYDPARDFVPLALAAQTPFVLVVHPDLPMKSVAELITWVKERPGKVSYATSGAGVPHHLFAELLKSMTGIQMSPVVYRGSLPALNDVIAGHVPLMFVDLGPALGAIQGGKVRALGISTAARLPTLPDVPPIGDTVKGFDAASWQMVVAPTATPRPAVDRLHADLQAVFAQPDVKAAIARTGMVPREGASVQELQAFIRAEIERWGQVVRQAGIAGSM